MRKAVATIVSVGMFVNSTCAELFTFDLLNKNGVSWDGVSSGIYTNAGSGMVLKAAMLACLNGSYSTGSQLNSTVSEFGVNAAGSGDATSLFDTINGQESLWISFDRAVIIKSITVSSFTSGNVETGAYQVAAGNLFCFTANGIHSIDSVLNQGDFFKVIALDMGGGNGWSLNSFTVEAVPEPVTSGLLGFGGLLVWLARRTFSA